MKGAEEAISRDCRELFQSPHDHHLVVVDVDAPGEYVETIENESGVELGKCRHRYEVVEG